MCAAFILPHKITNEGNTFISHSHSLSECVIRAPDNLLSIQTVSYSMKILRAFNELHDFKKNDFSSFLFV